MSSLFICATQFQILSALSICKEESLSDSIIVLANGIEKIPGWKDFLQKSNLFKLIIPIPNKPSFHDWIRILFTINGLKLHSSIARFISSLYIKTIRNKWTKGDPRITEARSIHQTRIDRVFISSPMDELWKIGKLTKHLNSDCKLYGFDEGLGSYLSSSFSNKQIDGIYLFQPHLSNSLHIKHKIQPLDRPEMAALWKLAKKCFDITTPPPRILFFDQWVGMPWINDTCGTTDWKNSSLIRLKLSLLKTIRDKLLVMNESLFYMPHPLQSTNATEFFLSKGYKLPNCRTSIPFELLLLCTEYDYANSLWVSIFSSAPIMPLLAFSSKSQQKTILLFSLFEKEQKLYGFFENGELLELIKNISSTYHKQLSTPKNLVELNSRLTSN